MGKFILSLDGPSFKIPNSIKSAPFDYVGRYQLIAEIISRYSKGSKKPIQSILDVGGLGTLLPQMLSTQVYVLDTKIDKESKYALNKHDATNPVLQDTSHDVVVSSDTIEHVARHDRQKFVDNLVRLSKDLIIVCAPTSDRRVVQEEAIVQKNYIGTTGKAHKWLKEHSDYELPSQKELLGYFQKHKLNTAVIKHSSVDIWRHLMFINLLADATKEGRVHRAVEEINRVYNDQLLFKDFTDNNYRTYIIASKKSEIVIDLSKSNTPSNADFLKLFKLTNSLYSTIIGFHIHDLPSVGVLGETFRLMQRKTSKLETKHNQLLAKYNHLLGSKTWRYTEVGRRVFRVIRKKLK